MKLVHIISSLQRGGAEMALANLLRTIRQQAHHTVIFFHDGPVRKDIEALGIICLRVSAPGSYCNPYFFIKLLRKIKRLQPDCLHTDLWAANLLGRICARLLRIPCVSVVHAMTEHEGKMRALIDRFIPCTPTRYVAVSGQVAHSLQQHKRLHHAPCLVIENGINVQAIRAAQGDPVLMHQLAAIKQSAFVIGSVGRLIPDKNYALLLQSFAQLRAEGLPVHLVIVGSGPEEINLKKIALQLHIAEQCTWIVGHLAYPYYEFFDCYVQPSRSEGFSITSLEALAFSLPVIVTGNNKQHAVIEDQQTGLVIEPDKLDELTSSLRYAFLQQDGMRQMGIRGHQIAVQKFCLMKTAQAYQTLFEKLVQ